MVLGVHCLPAPLRLAWGLALRLASAAWLLLQFPGPRRTTGQHYSVALGLRPIPKSCVPVPAGSVAGQYRPVHTNSWSARASPGGWYCTAVIGPQLLALFLDSRPFAPSGRDCLTREVESAVPGPPFLHVIQVEMSSCPVLPLRHTPSPWGNVWLGAFSSLQDPVPQHYLCTTKPLGRKHSLLLPQSQCPCSSPHCLMVYNKEQNVG